MGRRKSRQHEKLKPKWGPKHGKLVVLNKKRVAVEQLQTAIHLWFHDGDIAAMHALAASAHDCLAAMCSRIGKQSPYDEWLKELPRAEQIRMAYVRNFIAHGSKDPDDEVQHSVYHTESLIGFASDCYEFVFSSLTPMMHAFSLRFAMESPVSRNSSYPLWIKERFGHDADNITRVEFLKEYLPAFYILARDSAESHIKLP